MDTNSFVLTLLHLKGWGPKKVYDYVIKYKFNYEMCVQGLVNELNYDEKNDFKVELQKSKEILERNLNCGIFAINILDSKFPEKLYSMKDKCVFLFYKGNIELLNEKSIAIIGTRKPETEFVEKGKIVTKYFAEQGYVIVSGLALGCDTIAHETCLSVGGKTIAVLPSSCDNIQPTTNKKLAERIVENGGLLISEYSSGTPVSRFNYPERDRIQSLLSGVILIIQASDDSGTMIAAKKSIKDKKVVYALEGNNLIAVNNYVDAFSKSDMKEIETWIF